MDVFADALVLLLALRLSGCRLILTRIVFGALLGACAAWTTRRMNLTGGQAAALWLPVALGMMTVACGRRAIQRPMRSASVVLCAAGLLGGVIHALQGALGSLDAAYAAGCASTICIVSAAIRSHRAANDATSAYVRCTWREKTCGFEAIIDSGNTLRDYLTHRPVIVMPEADGMALFGMEACRLIFADTAGGRQMMRCYMPAETMLRALGKERRVHAAVALSSGMAAGAPVLVPRALIEEMNAD